MSDDTKTKITTSEVRKFNLLVVVERGFPAGAVSVHCPACGAHGIGATEAEAQERLLANIKERERSAWVLTNEEK